MEKLSNFIVKNRKYVLAFFLVSMIVCAVLSQSVTVNTDMTKYLPQDSEVVIAMNLNESEFGSNESIKVMITGFEQDKLDSYVENIYNINDKKTVLDVSEPKYEGDSVLYTVTFNSGLSKTDLENAVDDIREVLPSDKTALQGEAVKDDFLTKMLNKDMGKIMLVLIPIILIILLLTSKSFIEPLLCLIVIGVSILISMGTNVIFSDVSFITQSILSVLVIAISMDYSIFLLHSFKDERDKGNETARAVMNAVKKSFTAITASSLTTIAGFLALLVMRFTFGGDIGWVFAKAITISLATAIFLMPCLIMLFSKLIEKTSHRDLIPSFKGVGKGIVKIRWVIIPLVLIILVPAVIGNFSNNFMYGGSALNDTEGTSLYEESELINNTFGRTNQLVMLVPKGTTLKNESLLANELLEVKNVDSVTSLATIADAALLDADLETVYGMYQSYFDISKFHSENYSRIIIVLDTPEEGEEAFQAVQDIKAVGQKYYEDDNYLLGGTSVAYEMKTIIDVDYTWVTIIAILAIALIIMITFKSFSLPFILVLCIETGVFINMAIPFFMGQSLMFMGYLVIGTIQLGATIDYAILLTTKYLANRKTMKKHDAGMMAVHDSSASILTSGLILTGAGFVLGIISSNGIISQMGILLGRGALTSMILVFTFLPAMLVVSDKLIQKTTKNCDFLENELQ